MNEFTSEDVENIIKIKSELRKVLSSCISEISNVMKNIKFDFYTTNDGFYVSGGSIGSLLRGEKPKDYDIYLTDSNSVNIFNEIEEYTKNSTNNPWIKSNIDKLVKSSDTNYNIISGYVITDNAITLKNGCQLIRARKNEKGNYNTIDEIRKKFDFIHCIPYYDYKNDKLVISKEVYDFCINKTLKINNEKSIGSIRIKKFENAGWKFINETEKNHAYLKSDENSSVKVQVSENS